MGGELHKLTSTPIVGHTHDVLHDRRVGVVIGERPVRFTEERRYIAAEALQEVAQDGRPDDVPKQIWHRIRGIEAWIKDREAAVEARYGLIDGTEQRIPWQTPGKRTPIAVVHLHGFSASRQETAPLADVVADALGANLYETRLSGHGHASEPMAGEDSTSPPVGNAHFCVPFGLIA